MNEQLEKGIKHEMEHTTDPLEARRIAMVHLQEIPDYYDRIDKLEAEAKAEITMSTPLGFHKSDMRLGDQLTKDANTTQIPPKNIHQDARGELMMKRDEPVYNEADDMPDDEDFSEGTWVQAFRPGLHVDSDGVAHKWTPEDVESVAQQYNKSTDPKNPERHVAPVVLGHPKDNDPAMGWIEKAKAVGGKLWLKLSEMQPEFMDALKRGLYKTRSISLYPDLNIRHLGFLGASVPAVKGLGPFKFKEAVKCQTYEFTEGSMEDVFALKQENNWFKRLFQLFKIDTSKIPTEYKEANIASTDVDTISTINNKFPQGATMAEPLSPVTISGNYLEEIGKQVPGQDADMETKFKLAHDHLCGAYAHAAEKAGKDSSYNVNKAAHHCMMANQYLSNAKGAATAEKTSIYEKVFTHMMKAQSHLSKIDTDEEKKETSAQQVAEEKGTLTHPEPHVADHAEPEAVPTPGTKEIPVAEVKTDKDHIATLEKEVAELKALISKLTSENDKFTQEIANAKEKEVMQSYKEFCEALVGQGRMLPRDVDQNIMNLVAREKLDEQETMNFAEKNTPKVRNYLEEYKNYLQSMPKVVEFSEIATRTSAPLSSTGNDYVEEKIKSFMEANPKLSYLQAFNKLSIEEPTKVQEHLQNSVEPVKTGF
jgi:hypothetical protein